MLHKLKISSSPRTILANSPNYSDVANAIQNASYGDTVLVPAGSVVWDSNLIITKDIILKGGYGGSQTSITSAYNAPDPAHMENAANYIIAYTPVNITEFNKFRITKFNVDGNNLCAGILIKNVNSLGNTFRKLTNVRIDNNTFNNCAHAGGTARTINIYGDIDGVVDNNIFLADAIYVNKQFDMHGSQRPSWDGKLYSFGDGTGFYFEDNVVDIFTTPTSCGEGGIYIVRYNTYTYTSTTAALTPWFDAHGNQLSGVYGTMAVEIYGNKLIYDYSNDGMLFDQRGGKALAFFNRIDISTSAIFTLRCREEFDDSEDPNNNAQPQHVSQSYFWNNRYGSILIPAYTGTTLDYPPLTGVPAENREYHNYNALFDGTLSHDGMGCGLLSSRPSVCKVGQAYWVTDQNCTTLGDSFIGNNPSTPISGTLYICLNENVWTQFYTPYTYPHPLRNILND